MNTLQTVAETIKWLNRIGRPPLPECPIEAATVGKDPKQPQYIDGWRGETPYVKTVQWKTWQTNQPQVAQTRVWFKDSKTGIGTLGGFNGVHWLAWVDFDVKDFLNQEDCDRTIAAWIERYPILATAPRFKTPSGGYRFLVGWETEPENFKANSKFTLDQGGTLMGELLTKNGAHTLLPPTQGLNGQYVWEYWQESPPIVDSPESVGIYPVKVEAKNVKTAVKGTKTDLEAARDYLSWIPNQNVHYDDWLAVGMALHSVDDSLLNDWRTWSAQSDKDIDGECDRKWASFTPNGGVGIGTLGELAKANGWKPTKNTKALKATTQDSAIQTNDDGDELAQEPSGKPRLDIRSGQIEQAANTVLSHFGSAIDPRNQIFAMGNSQGQIFVRVLRTVTGIENRYLHVSKGYDVLDPVTPESLQWEINRTFQIYRWVEIQGTPTEKRVDCPASLPKQILAMGRWPQLNVLTGLSQTPLLTKTGEVIMQPGYHKGTGYLSQFDPADFPLMQNPTKPDAIAALKKLKDLLSEFCFKTDVDRSAALSLLLTAVSRKLYALAPLMAVNAHQPGTGKGTLINIACILATGNKEAGVTGFTDDEAEMTKKMLATLLSGTSFVSIDNVDRRLGGGTLERVLTAEYIKERILGVSKNAVCSTQVTWTANGNNLSFTPDMARRTVLCELDAGMEAPETRTFTRDIEAFTALHRGELVSAALTIMQAFILAGSPIATDADDNPINPPPLGSFGGWDAVVRRSLLWLGEPDPVQSQATIRDSDDGRIALGVLLEAWHIQLGEQAMQVRDVVQRAIATDGDFKHAILEVCLDRQGQPSTKLMGYYLRRNNGVVVNGYRVVRGTRLTLGFPWKVEKIQLTENQNRSKTSTSFTSASAGTIDAASLDVNVDEKGIYIDSLPQKTVIATEGNVDKTSTLHLHQPKTTAQKELQPLLNKANVDNVDVSDQSQFVGKRHDDDEWESIPSIEIDLDGGTAE